MNSNNIRVVVILTHQCNFKCHYCTFCNDDKKISDEVIKKIINVLKTFEDTNFELQFFGGEPLLELRKIKEIVSSLKNKKNIDFLITTNGSLINQEVINLLKETNIKVSLSIDGDSKTQDRNRKFKNGSGSYKELLSSINRLNKEKIVFNTELVVTPKTVINLYNNLIHIEKTGARGVFLMPVCGYSWPKNSLSKLKKELRKYSNYYLSNQTKFRLLNLKNKPPHPLFNTEITIDYDGKVYSGNGFLINPKTRTNLLIGNLLKEDFFEIVKRKKSEEYVSKIIFPKKIVNSYKNASKIIESFCEEILFYKKVEKRDLLLKEISIALNLNNNRDSFVYLINKEDKIRNHIIKSLEKKEGLDFDLFEKLFDIDFVKEFKKEIVFLIKTKKAGFENGFFKVLSKNKKERVIISKYFYSKKILNELKKLVGERNTLNK